MPALNRPGNDPEGELLVEQEKKPGKGKGPEKIFRAGATGSGQQLPASTLQGREDALLAQAVAGERAFSQNIQEAGFL